MSLLTNKFKNICPVYKYKVLLSSQNKYIVWNKYVQKYNTNT